MDLFALAAAAVTALVPYLRKAAEKFAGNVGDAAWKKAGELYEGLKARLAGHPAADALDKLAAEPDNARAQADFRQALKELAASDPEFARELAALMPNTGVSFHNEIQGNVENQIQTTGDIGTINLGSKQR
jgi:hypothetical protein